jgi:hypothetical protein
MAATKESTKRTAASPSMPKPVGKVERLYAEYQKKPKGSDERQSAFNVLMKAVEDESGAR